MTNRNNAAFLCLALAACANAQTIINSHESQWRIASAALRAGGQTSPGMCVTVTLKDAGQVSALALLIAKGATSRIFADIGVPVYWSKLGAQHASEPCEKIDLQFTSDSPSTSHPGALAYALPYQWGGTQIRVFTDRCVLRYQSLETNGVFLGYVMGHEIGHVLERISRHSGRGVMKAQWTEADLKEMYALRLRFDGHDADLIRSGLSGNLGLASRSISYRLHY